MSRTALIATLIALLTTAPCAPARADAEAELARAETEWLAAYTLNDRDAMSEFLANGFTITFPDGRVDTRQNIIDSMDPERAGVPPEEGRETHYTRDREIRLLGDTAILTGVYVAPSNDSDRPDLEWRYTDTWMRIDGRWRVVASGLAFTELPCGPGN